MGEENKKIDGIKKLSQEEIIKARKLVLEAIKNSSLNRENKETEIKKEKKINMIDGLLRPRTGERQKQPKKIKKQGKIDEVVAPDFVHDEAAKEKLKEKSNRTKTPGKNKTEVDTEKRKAAREKIKRAQALAARKRQLQKQKALERIKRRKLKKEKQKKLKEEFNKKIKKSLALAKIKIKLALTKALFLLLSAFIFSILFYLIFLILVLKFDLDNNFTRRIALYCPLPAIVAKSGIINYYEYKDFKKEIINSTETDYANIKLLLAKKIILNNLINKYNLKTEEAKNEEEIKKILEQKIAADFEINTVGLERIKKIKKLINKNGDFIQTANKFGDEQGLLNIDAGNEKDYSFAKELKSLNIGQVSDIIITPAGYYIFKCYEKSKKTSGLSYVFIHAKGLNQYLDEAALNLKMWSLVD